MVGATGRHWADCKEEHELKAGCRSQRQPSPGCALTSYPPPHELKNGAAADGKIHRWGRNSHNVAGPSVPDSETIKKPKLVTPLNGVVLRDLAVSETYGGASSPFPSCSQLTQR